MSILSRYKTIPWDDVFGMRNFLSHQYVEVDAEGIFTTIKQDIPTLLDVTRQILDDLKKGVFDTIIKVE